MQYIKHSRGWAGATGDSSASSRACAVLPRPRTRSLPAAPHANWRNPLPMARGDMCRRSRWSLPAGKPTLARSRAVAFWNRPWCARVRRSKCQCPSRSTPSFRLPVSACALSRTVGAWAAAARWTKLPAGRRPQRESNAPFWQRLCPGVALVSIDRSGCHTYLQCCTAKA